MKLYFQLLTLFVGLLAAKHSFANLPSAPALPISHCYHWLDERTQKFLTFKYDYAAKSGGEFSFFTTGGNGAVAGAGIYCAKTIMGSYGYGDRVVRIDFVDDIVESQGSRQICGTNGQFYKNQADCDRQPVDVELFNTANEWYVIKNPKAVKSWSANDDSLMADLKAIKPYADSSAASHMDLTALLIQTELQSKVAKKQTFINPSARLDLMDILKDPKKVQSVPVLSLIEMIAAAPQKKISQNDKEKYFDIHLGRALKDSALAYGDYESLLKKFPEVGNHLRELMKNINYRDLTGYNPVVLITAIDKLSVDAGGGNIRDLWKAVWSSNTSFQSLLAVGFKKDGEVLKNFDAFIPENFDVSQVQDNNVGYLLSLLNSYAPAGKSYEQLTEKLLGRLVRGPQYYTADSVYNQLNNASLEKETALINVVTQFAFGNDSDLDLLAMASLVERVQDKLNKDQAGTAVTRLGTLSLKVSPRLTYLLLEDYKSGRLKLPSSITRESFLNRLVERSIAERSLGTNTTNTYRMILSGFYSVFAADLQAQKDDAGKKKVMQEAGTYFKNLTDLLAKNNANEYVYVSLQNAEFFANDMQYTEHPLEKLFTQYFDDSKSLDPAFESLIVNSFDSGAMLYLLSASNSDNKAKAARAQSLLNKILTQFIAADFPQKLKEKGFKLTDNERRIWANILKNKALAPEGTLRSDICSFNVQLHTAQEALKAKFPKTWPAVEKTKNQIYAICHQ